MATAPVIEKVALSQMPVEERAFEDSLVAGLSNGRNVTFKAGAIADLVTKQRLNLDKVQNLAPSEMPVSDPQAAALNKKLDKDGTINIPQVNGLVDALADKLGKTDEVAIGQVTGLQAKLTELETGPVHVSRITDFTPAVEDVINSRADLKNEVIKGPMDW